MQKLISLKVARFIRFKELFYPRFDDNLRKIRCTLLVSYRNFALRIFLASMLIVYLLPDKGNQRLKSSILRSSLSF